MWSKKDISRNRKKKEPYENHKECQARGKSKGALLQRCPIKALRNKSKEGKNAGKLKVAGTKKRMWESERLKER